VPRLKCTYAEFIQILEDNGFILIVIAQAIVN